MKFLKIFLVVILFSTLFLTENLSAQERSFTEGSVWDISYVRTKLPYFNDYMTNLSNGWRKVEAKKEGLILNYMVLSSQASNQDDWNLMLMIEYKNMAAFDGLFEKMDNIRERLFGSEEDQQKSAVARNDIREILGDRTTRQLVFK
ncbi:MAG: hypothetical protein Q7S39_00690 [Ignavibacteria bacterium]|nr:hypothetical protein [Ignavibacteria bacterium]